MCMYSIQRADRVASLVEACFCYWTRKSGDEADLVMDTDRVLRVLESRAVYRLAGRYVLIIAQTKRVKSIHPYPDQTAQRRAEGYANETTHDSSAQPLTHTLLSQTHTHITPPSH